MLVFHAEHRYYLSAAQIWALLFPLLRVMGVPRKEKEGNIYLSDHTRYQLITSWQDANQVLSKHKLYLRVTPTSISLLADKPYSALSFENQHFYLALVDSYSPEELATIHSLLPYRTERRQGALVNLPL